MAKKSKTQRAKASARRAEKRATDEVVEITEGMEESEDGASAAKAAKSEPVMKKEKVLAKSDSSSSSTKAATKTAAKEPGRIRTFISGVRSEMKRVTWPTGLDVARWSGVVVAALVFFGLYVFILDNYIVTPILLAISSLGA